MKKLFVSLLLVFAMAFSCCTVGFASVPEEEVVTEPRLTSSIIVAVSRESGTSGGATVDCNFAGTMDSFTTSVYLQKLSNGSWVNDTANEDYVVIVYGSNRSSATFDVSYNKLVRGTSYRLKVVSKTTKNGISYQRSGYSQVF